MKILLDMGHCLRGSDTGTQGNGKREENCTREIGYKFKSKMEALGHTVIVCSCDSSNSVNESLSYRTNKANNTGGDLYVAIHLNSGGGFGTEIFTYGAKSFTEANNVLNNFIALGLKNRGIKDGKGLYVINHTNMKSMLVECCFMDTNDMQKYSAENFANAIVKGITGTSVDNTDSIPKIIKIEEEIVMNDFTTEQKARQQKFVAPSNNNVIPEGDNITKLNGGSGWIEVVKGRVITHLSRVTYYSLWSNGNMTLTHCGETRNI